MQSEKEGTLFNENAGYVPDASYFRNPSLTSYMPVRIFTETGCVKKHKDEFARLGKKALIVVTGMYAAEKSGALNDVCGSLDALGIPWEIFDRINPNPALTDCMCAAETAVKAGCDFVVGIGGGSALDAAKCIAVLAANPGMSQTELYSLSWPVKPLPVAAVGTTAGTGSEVTKVSVITVPEGRKKSFHHEDVFPAAAFGDASYTVSLPLDITFSTAIDALSHAVESYFSRNANSISRCYSVQAVKMLFPML
ncbi:MAG: iron-containing alcohol dehydrogenase, partial [Parasporobacterium sp.]|nr:iron-containing alcohol dehydrogenase [Parasporobacterium sp.]